MKGLPLRDRNFFPSYHGPQPSPPSTPLFTPQHVPRDPFPWTSPSHPDLSASRLPDDGPLGSNHFVSPFGARRPVFRTRSRFPFHFLRPSLLSPFFPHEHAARAFLDVDKASPSPPPSLFWRILQMRDPPRQRPNRVRTSAVIYLAGSGRADPPLPHANYVKKEFSLPLVLPRSSDAFPEVAARDSFW